ncbi:MAG: tetratricopeptide repeat protein [Pseudomonadota bacterium]
MNKQYRVVLIPMIIVGLLFAGATKVDLQDFRVQYEKARFLMETEGDLEEAAKIFQFIIKNHPHQRAYAAGSMYHLGICYERMGKQNALVTYENILASFPDQKDIVSLAKRRIRHLKSLLRKPEINAESSNMQVIWSGDEVDPMGSLSPDGRYLTFVDWDTGDLAVRDLNKGQNRRLTDKGSWDNSTEMAFESVWSPDGKHIAYSWLKDNKQEIRVIPFAEGNPRVISPETPLLVDHIADWSPNGRQLLVLFKDGKTTYEISLVDWETGHTRRLKTIQGKIPEHLSFSPDNRFIAYNLEVSLNNKDIFVLGINWEDEYTAVQHPALDSLIGWSPFSNTLLFISTRTKTNDLWGLEFDRLKETQPFLLKAGIGFIETMGISRQGSLFFSHSVPERDIFVSRVDFETGNILTFPQRLFQNYEGENFGCSLSPNGKYLAYISRHGTRAQQREINENMLCLYSLEKNEQKEFYLDLQLPLFPTITWGNNNAHIYFQARTNDLNKIEWPLYQFNVQDGSYEVAVNYPESTGLRSITRDASLLIKTEYIQSEESHYSQIMTHNLQKNLVTILYAEEGRLKDVHLDPRKKYIGYVNTPFSKEGMKSDKLKILPIEGGSPQTIYSVDDPQIIYSFGWMPDGQSVIVCTMNKEKDCLYELHHVFLGGGKSLPIKLSLCAMRDLSVHPDGERLYMTAGLIAPTEIWTMKNFLKVDEKNGGIK